MSTCAAPLSVTPVGPSSLITHNNRILKTMTASIIYSNECTLVIGVTCLVKLVKFGQVGISMKLQFDQKTHIKVCVTTLWSILGKRPRVKKH